MTNEHEHVAADRPLMARSDIAANSTLKALRNTLAYALLVSLFALLWFNAAPANAQTPVLDDISAPSAAAYSLRKLRAAYTGSAVRVRRSSDNAEANIGFASNGDLDTTALLAHVGGGNGFVTTWYDQSGNGSNATQATAANQPRIVSNGVLHTLGGRPTIRSFGVTEKLFFTSAALGSATAFSFNSVSTVGANGSRKYAMLFGSGFGSPQGSTAGIRWGLFGQGNLSADGIGWAGPDSNLVLGNGNLIAPSTNYVQTFLKSSTAWNYYQNGGLASANIQDTTRPTSEFRGVIFSERTDAYTANANCSELVLFPSALSTTDRQTLEINQGLYYDTSVSAGLFGLWQSDGAGGSGTATTTNLLQTWSAQLVSHASQTNNAGTFNGSAPLSQYINRVTGTDVVSDAEFDAGFTITGKAAAGAQSTIRFYLDNDRTNGTEEIGTQLTNGSNGVTWTYDNATGEYTISFAAGSAALQQATHNTYGSGVHKLTVDTDGSGVMQATEASRLFLVANGTALTTDTGQALQNYSVQDRPTGNVFVYFYGDPDGNGIGLWTLLDNTDTASNPGVSTADRDGLSLNSNADWDYYNAGTVLAGTQATTGNTALGFVTSIAAQVWEFQMGQSASTAMNWSTAKTWAGNHTDRGSNTSRMASLAETLALYAANFAGGNTPGAVEAMTSLTSTTTTTVAGENNAPGGWTGTNIWTAAPTPSGNAVVSLSLGHVLDDLGTATYNVAAVL